MASITEHQDGTNNIIVYDGVVNPDKLLVGGSSINSNAVAQFDSTTQALVVPRMTTAQRNTLSGLTPLSGAVVFNLNTGNLEVFTGAAWEAITSVNN